MLIVEDRIICLMGPVNDYVSSIVVAQLLFLQSESSKKPIHMYINSPGGSVTAGLAIYDTMQVTTTLWLLLLYTLYNSGKPLML